MELNELREFTLGLSLVKGLGPAKFRKLIEHYGGIEKMFQAYLEKDLGKRFAIEVKRSQTEEVLKVLLKKYLNYICVWENTYPEVLKEISDPPIVIYYKGVTQWSNLFSVVGTRSMSSYGNKVCKNISRDLASLGYGIVSGMAMGVDRVAHEATLEVNGYTLAVLASSVDTPTPAINEKLYYSILDKGGLVISEVPPGTLVGRGMFLSRNRIIAGVSIGTLIIEAARKSGALTTGNLALNYNREVFAVPGNIDSEVSRGCNYLIKSGQAKLVEDVSDILVEYGYEIGTIAGAGYSYDIDKLNVIEKKIYNQLLGGAKLVEELSNFLKIEISAIIASCSVLELKGIIRKKENGEYCIC